MKRKTKPVHVWVKGRQGSCVTPFRDANYRSAITVSNSVYTQIMENTSPFAVLVWSVPMKGAEVLFLL